MGYRSEVSLTMKKEDIAELLTLANEKRGDDSLKEFLEFDEVFDHKNGYMTLYWDWIKWYDNYIEIALVEDFIGKALAAGKDVSFKRLGEEDQDIESRWCGDWEVCEQVQLIRKLEIERGHGVSWYDLIEKKS